MLYIDDVSILVSNKKITQNTRMLEDVARTAFEWAQNNVITFDDSKSELIHFENTHRITNESVRLTNSTTVHATENVKWLRIWFDRKLRFNTHVKRKKTSMLRAFNVIQTLSNSERGLTRGAMRQLCISTVFSVSDYGSEVWFRNQSNFVKEMQTVQNKR